MLTTANWLGQKYSQLNKAGQAASAVQTIEVLAARLKEASAPEDRRAAIFSLKGISRDHPKQVGDHALGAIVDTLEQEAGKPPGQGDEEVVRALVETCITLCDVSPPAANDDGSLRPTFKPSQAAAAQGLQFSNTFLDRAGPVQSLLPLLSSKRAFYTRFASLQLLGTLLRNGAARVQEHVLVAPGGCGAILECIAEDPAGPSGATGTRSGSSAEIIRNEALLVLPHLVHGNSDVQKLVAFEGAFEKLLDVVAQEGRIEGGVVVQDALEGLEALLRYNVSNQNYFRETISIPMLAPLLFFPPPPPQSNTNRQAEQEHARQLEAFAFQEWDDQKVLNARLVIGIAGLLVSGQGDGKRQNQVCEQGLLAWWKMRLTAPRI